MVEASNTLNSNSLSIAVIGTGISGLSFTKLFKSSFNKKFNNNNIITKNLNITIFEARNRIGGRINTNTTFCSLPIELGAEEIHGANSEMYKIVKKHKKIINLEKLEAYCEFDNKFDNWDNFEYKNDHFMLLSQFFEDISNKNKISKLDSNATLYDYYDILKKEYKIKDDKIFHLINGTIAVDYSTDLKKISAKKYSEIDWNWRSGEENYGIINGSYTDILYLEFSEEIKQVQLSKEIKKIVVLKDKCLINDENEFDLVICSVPIPIIMDIEFIPKLKEEKIKAIKKLLPDDAAKLILKFKEKFWKDDTGEIYVNGYFQILWPSYKQNDTNNSYKNEYILTAMISGENCRYIESLYRENPQKVIDLVINDLKRVYADKNIVVTDYLWHNWMNEKYSKGAYTHPSLHEEDSRKIIEEPHEGKIFFIGDALAPYGHISTVHGSYECSKLLVDKILKN